MFWQKKGIKESPLNRPSAVNKNFKKFIVKAAGLIARQGASRENFSYPEYDLEEIKVASASDSYIKQSLMKYSYLVYKAGYTLKGENEKAVSYIKTRFRIMSFATRTPMDLLFQEIGDDLVKYSNAFLVKSRVEQVMPGVKATGVFGNKPVGGYFRIDPASVQIKRDKNGKIQKYRQIVNGEEKSFSPSDIVHFYIDKDADNAFGTPRISAALEDVKLLRKIEGNVISLIYRFAIPIYQWMIGIPEAGFQASDKEIDEAKAEVEKMAMDGVIVTNERTKVKAIGAEGVALDASGYLQYFEKRVFTALGVSESQMGRGGAKKDADSMEAQCHDTVKHIQKVISIIAENYILNELLLEGGFNPITKEEDIVQYEFEEISLDTKVKVENHEILKFQSNVTTLEETRRKLGKKESVDEKRLYANMIEKKSAIEQINAKAKAVERIKADSSKEATGVVGNGKEVSSKPNGEAKSIAMPTNQHGTTSVKIKESSDSNNVLLLDNKKKDLQNHKKNYSSIYKKYKQLSNDISRDNEKSKYLIDVAKDSILKEVKSYMLLSSQDGIKKAIEDIGPQGSVVATPKVDLTELEKYAQKIINGLMKDIEKHLKSGKQESTVFEILEYRLRYLIEYIVPKSHWYSYVKTCAQLGIEHVYIDFEGSDDGKGKPSKISTKDFDWGDIPAYHSFCDCKVGIKAGDKK